MKPLKWHHKVDEYSTSILDFNAIITELPQSRTFTVRIEDDQGNILKKHPQTFYDFEETESWSLFMVVDLEQLGDQPTAQARMLQSLDYSRSFLPSTIHPTHLQRIDNIRDWIVTGRGQGNELDSVSTTPSSQYSLDWSDDGGDTYLADTPHGQVTIYEKQTKRKFTYGTTSKYKPQIRHSTGAIYESLQTFIDFVDAEIWIQETLAKLDDPRIGEDYLENLHFTLEICRHVLPSESDPLHSERLKYLSGRFGEVLP